MHPSGQTTATKSGSIAYTHQKLNRTKTRKLTNGSNVITATYNFAAGSPAVANSTTTLVKEIKYTLGGDVDMYDYTYDARGNITRAERAWGRDDPSYV